MAGRRGWGEDSIYFDHSGECRDPKTHRHCPGRWRGVVSLKPGPDGQRRRKKVSGKNKSEVRAKLAELHDELNDGVVTNATYTVAQAINDWLADGLAGRAPKTVSTQREVLDPLIGIIGAVPLRELTAATVRSALKDLAATRATRTVAIAHAGLTRAIRHAEANDKVRRNVATLVDTPVGQGGPPVQVAHIRAGRCPDRGGPVVRFVRLRCPEPPSRRPNRGGAGTAVGLRRPGGRPGRQPACASPCRRLALGTCPWRHQDEEVPAFAGTAQDGGGSAPGAPAATGRRAATCGRSVAGQRARLHYSAR